jgi:hypothetical protein
MRCDFENWIIEIGFVQISTKIHEEGPAGHGQRGCSVEKTYLPACIACVVPWLHYHTRFWQVGLPGYCIALPWWPLSIQPWEWSAIDLAHLHLQHIMQNWDAGCYLWLPLIPMHQVSLVAVADSCDIHQWRNPMCPVERGNELSSGTSANSFLKLRTQGCSTIHHLSLVPCAQIHSVCAWGNLIDHKMCIYHCRSV